MAQNTPITPVPPVPVIANGAFFPGDPDISQGDDEPGSPQDEIADRHLVVPGAFVQGPAAPHEGQNQPPAIAAARDVQNDVPNGNDAQGTGNNTPNDTNIAEPLVDDLPPNVPNQGDGRAHTANTDPITPGQIAADNDEDNDASAALNTAVEDSENIEVATTNDAAAEDDWNNDTTNPNDAAANPEGAVTNDWHDGAPGFDDSNPALETGPWHNTTGWVHNRNVYKFADFELHGTRWRWDVSSRFETYRISTIADDFIGSVWSNGWTIHVKYARHCYKANELLYNALVYNEWDPATRREGCLFFLKLKWLAMLRAGQRRIDFLRRWPNAYEAHGGTATHWNYAGVCFDNAERVRIRARNIAATPVDPDEVDDSGDFRSLIRADTIQHLISIQYYGRYGAEAGLIAIGFLHDLLDLNQDFKMKDAETENPDTENPDPEEPEWWDVPVPKHEQIGSKVYAVSPDQYEYMRTTQTQMKDALITALNDPLSRVTLQHAPNVVEPYLPRLPTDLLAPGAPPASPNLRLDTNSLHNLAAFTSDATPPWIVELQRQKELEQALQLQQQQQPGQLDWEQDWDGGGVEHDDQDQAQDLQDDQQDERNDDQQDDQYDGQQDDQQGDQQDDQGTGEPEEEPW